MSDTISLGFKLTGEADFKRALTDINNQLKLNSSELGLASAKYAENGKSVEALTAKNKLLKESLDIEKQNIDTLKSAIDKSTSSHAAAGTQIEKLKTSLSDAKDKMEEMRKSSDTTKEDLLKQQNVVKDLSKELKTAEKAYETTGKNTTQWGTKLNEAETRVISLNKQLNENEKQLKKVDTNTNSFGGKIADLGNKISDTDEKLGGGLTKSVEAFGLAAIAAGGLAAKSFLDFDEQMTKVKTLADDSVVSMSNLQNSILNISSATAKSANDVAEATYDALSSGIKTVDVQNFMAQSSKTAVSGFTDVSTSVDILTTILNSYGMKTAEVTDVSDKLLLAQDKGKITVGEFSQGLGDLVGIASNAGVSLNEVLSGTAALSMGGLKGSSGITALKAAISNIIKPTAEAEEQAKKLHIAFNSQALEAKGLSGILEDVRLKTGGSADQMGKLFGSVEALNAVMILTGKQNGTFKETLLDMNNVAGKTDEMFKKISESAGFQFQQSLTSLKNTAIEVGSKLTPLINLISGIITMIGNIPAPILITIGSIALAISATLKIISTMDKLAGLGGPVGNFFTGLDAHSIKTTAIILGVVAALIALAAIIAVIIGKSQEMNNSLANVGNTVNKVKSSAMDSSSSAASSIRQKSVSSLPAYATGTSYHPGGRALVGENGPEIVDLPAGSKVYPNGVMPSSGNITNTYYVNISAKDVKEFNDIVRLANQANRFKVQGAY